MTAPSSVPLANGKSSWQAVAEAEAARAQWVSDHPGEPVPRGLSEFLPDDLGAAFRPRDNGHRGFESLINVGPEKVSWLWRGYIPRGKLTMLDGDPKVGKSTVMLDVAAHVSTGRALPGDHEGDASAVIIATAEDGLADTVRPRIDAAGGDPQRIFAWTESDADCSPCGSLPPALPQDIDQLEKMVVNENVGLIVLDVLVAFLSSSFDSHRDPDMRRALWPLTQLADRTGAAIVAIRHLNKSGGTNPLYRGGGSIAISGAARSLLLAARDRDDPAGRRHVLASVASNLAPTPPSYAYELVGDEAHGCARVHWLGESGQTAGALLSGGDDTERTAVAEACDVLADMLVDGGLPASEVQRRCRDAGVSLATLRRAKTQMGVTSKKYASGWVWILPDDKDARGAAKVLK